MFWQAMAVDVDDTDELTLEVELELEMESLLLELLEFEDDGLFSVVPPPHAERSKYIANRVR
jgi:hypothetical protein